MKRRIDHRMSGKKKGIPLLSFVNIYIYIHGEEKRGKSFIYQISSILLGEILSCIMIFVLEISVIRCNFILFTIKLIQ